jgi:hypothetical protein
MNRWLPWCRPSPPPSNPYFAAGRSPKFPRGGGLSRASLSALVASRFVARRGIERFWPVQHKRLRSARASSVTRRIGPQPRSRLLPPVALVVTLQPEPLYPPTQRLTSAIRPQDCQLEGEECRVGGFSVDPVQIGPLEWRQHALSWCRSAGCWRKMAARSAVGVSGNSV